jgi:hypothetical protein
MEEDFGVPEDQNGFWITRSKGKGLCWTDGRRGSSFLFQVRKGLYWRPLLFGRYSRSTAQSTLMFCILCGTMTAELSKYTVSSGLLSVYDWDIRCVELVDTRLKFYGKAHLKGP